MKEFNELETYKQKLINKKITDVEFADNADEGLRISFDDGSVLIFGFSGHEGFFAIGFSGHE